MEASPGTPTEQEQANVRAIVRRAWEILASRKAEHVKAGRFDQAMAIVDRQMQLLSDLRRQGVSIKGLEITQRK